MLLRILCCDTRERASGLRCATDGTFTAAVPLHSRAAQHHAVSSRIRVLCAVAPIASHSIVNWARGCDTVKSLTSRTIVLLYMQSDAKSRVGTPGYMAPEVVANRPREGQTYDGKPADLWSAGVIMYIMLCARFPFERPDDSQLEYQEKLKRVLQRIVNVEYKFPRCAPSSCLS